MLDLRIRTRALMTSITIIIVLASVACSSTPDPKYVDDIQTTLDQWRSEHELTGISLAVHTPEQELMNVTSGFSDINSATEMTPDGVMYGGSIAKTFTAAAILRLAEEGKLSLEDPLSKWYPGFPNADDITIKQMLNMTSGIFDYFRASPDNPVIGVIMQDVSHEWTPEEIVELVSTLEPTSAPGAAYDYSNTGYVFLGLIIEQVTGHPYEDVMRSFFFDPLELDDTYTAGRDQTADTLTQHYARDFGFVFGSEEPITEVNGKFAGIETLSWAAGSVVSDADDLLKWSQALYGGEVLNQSSLKAMLEIDALQPAEGFRYGYGVEIRQTSIGMALGHAGGTPASAALMIYVPEKNISVVAMSNDGWADQKHPLDTLVDEVLRIADRTN